MKGEQLASPVDGSDEGGCDGDMAPEEGTHHTYLCSACLRDSSKDSSFYAVGGEAEFRYASKSIHLCVNCHTVWRLLYKARLTVVLMDRHLRNWLNKTKFLGEVIALVSLRYENTERVTPQKLSQRHQVLQFVFDLCGAPFPFFKVTPLNGYNIVIPSSFRPVMSQLGGSYSLEALVPAEERDFRAKMNSWSLRLASGELQRLTPSPMTERRSDVDWWKTAYDKSIESQPALENSSGPSASGAEASGTAADSLLMQKAQITLEATLCVMHSIHGRRLHALVLGKRETYERVQVAGHEAPLYQT